MNVFLTAILTHIAMIMSTVTILMGVRATAILAAEMVSTVVAVGCAPITSVRSQNAVQMLIVLVVLALMANVVSVQLMTNVLAVQCVRTIFAQSLNAALIQTALTASTVMLTTLVSLVAGMTQIAHCPVMLV